MKKNLKFQILELGLYLIRHDVLNALTKVKGYGELMDIIEKEKWQKDWGEQIRISSVKIEKLIKLVGGYLRLEEDPESIKVGKEFREAIQFYPELEKDIDFENQCETLQVKAHPGVMSHVFYNMIHNSVIHAGPQLSEIGLFCQATEDKTEIIYRDDGIGIKPQNKEQIFEKGFSGGTSSGLGLYLIQKICEAYKWNIKESGQYQKGVEFRISIPK